MSEHEGDTTSGMAESGSVPESSDFIQAIRSWLHVCEHEHTCVAKTGTRQSPIWLIDTKYKCIVRGTDQRYVALSYTWQEPSPTSPAEPKRTFQLDRKTLSMLQQPGSLSRSDIAHQLPKAIKGAIELVPLIGERYLWVDRLCIVQGESSTKSEVMRMDEIYSGAYVTLVAAASHGLYGRQETTALNACYPEVWQKPTFAKWLFGFGFQDEAMPHYQVVSESRWATRAWTYQEHILSKRIIFFLDDRVFWECDASVWDMFRLLPRTDNHHGERRGDIGARLMAATRPDFSLYVDLVCPYNGRDLTYSGDGLSACSGMLNRLARSFPGGFIYGLPKLAIDHALLWQPLRRCYRRKGLATGTDFPFPSWSWCGWQCYLDPRSFLSGISAFQESAPRSIDSSWKTQTCIDWSIRTSAGGSHPVSEAFENDDLLPQLVCRAERACFYVADTLWISEPSFISGPSFTKRLAGGGSPLSEMMPVVVLQDKSGNFSGLLKTTDDIKYKQGDKIELIAISKGTANYTDI